MNELALKYGCNPNQKPSRIYMEDGSDLPVTVLNGKPGYINFLDALNSIQLVKELKAACGPARGGLVQARFPGGRGPGPAPDRGGAEDVPHCPGFRALPAGLRLCPRPRCRSHVLASATGSPSPRSVMSPPQSSSSTKSPTASLPRATSRKP